MTKSEQSLADALWEYVKIPGPPSNESLLKILLAWEKGNVSDWYK